MVHNTLIIIGMVFIALGFLIVINEVEGKSITVDANGGADITKIQDAINISSDGDTIRVWEGTYYENVVVNKAVSMIGNGSGQTAIDAGGDGAVVTISADMVNMSGFHVTGSWFLGTGIKMESNNIHLFGNKCTNNYYSIYLCDSNNNSLANNTVSDNDNRGIYLRYSSNNTLTNNTITGNGGGIYLTYSSNNTLTNNTVSGNDGSGIKFDESSSNTLTYNTITGNGGGIYLSTSNDNTLTNNTVSGNDGSGINFDESSNNTLTNNTVSDNDGSGFSLSRSNDNTLTNNTALENDHGIYLSNSNGNILIDNTVSDSDERGIYYYNSNGNTLTSNNVSDNEHGFYLSYSNNNVLSNNTASNNSEYGIYLYRSNDNTLRKNAMSNNSYNFHLVGSSFSHFNQSMDPSNTVDSKLIYYLVGNQSETIDIDALNIGYFACINSSGITVKNAANLTTNGFGILFFDTDNSVIQSITTHSNKYGIYLHSSHNNTLIDNTIFDNERGIYLASSNGNILSNNSVPDNERGIYLASSNGNILNNNIVSDNENGIYLRSSHNTTLSNNIFTDNEYGVYLFRSHNTTLTDSTISAGEYGIYLNSSNDNAFKNSIITKNRVGIYLRSSSQDNNVHDNIIFENTDFGINGTENNGFFINASYNWWGDRSGPYYPENNSMGKGDNVTKNVIFRSWLIKIRNMRPEITYVNVKNNSVVEYTVEIIVSAIDHDGIIDSVEISINGSSWIHMDQFLSNWSYWWDSRDLPDGETDIKIRCYDYEEYSDEITLIIKVNNSTEDKDITDDNNKIVRYILYLLLIILITIFISVIAKVVDVRIK